MSAQTIETRCRDVLERVVAAHDAGDATEQRVAYAYALALLADLRRTSTPRSPEADASRPDERPTLRGEASCA